MIELSEIERDAIAEILNIAIGQAARSLSEMVDEAVTLSVPIIEFLTSEEACRLIDRQTGTAACAVRESFAGPFPGDTLLIFPEDKSLELVRRLVGEPIDLKAITEMEQDALMEIGNVILSSCLSTMADTLGLEISNTTLPEIVRGTGRDILGPRVDPAEEDRLILFMEVDFTLQQSDITGYVLIALGLASAEALKKQIQKHLEGLTD